MTKDVTIGRYHSRGDAAESQNSFLRHHVGLPYLPLGCAIAATIIPRMLSE